MSRLWGNRNMKRERWLLKIEYHRLNRPQSEWNALSMLCRWRLVDADKDECGCLDALLDASTASDIGN